MVNEHTRFINNDIQNNFNMVILYYSKHVHKMFGLDKYLSTTRRNNDYYHYSYWDTREIVFSEDEIFKEMKEALPAAMYNEVEEKEKYYWSIP